MSFSSHSSSFVCRECGEGVEVEGTTEVDRGASRIQVGSVGGVGGLEDSYILLQSTIAEAGSVALGGLGGVAEGTETAERGETSSGEGAGGGESGGGGGAVVDGASGGAGASVADDLRRRAGLAQLGSGQERLDHPLCLECADHALKKVDGELEEAKWELEQYERYLAASGGGVRAGAGAGGGIGDGGALRETGGSGGGGGASGDELSALEREEAELEVELARIESERRNVREAKAVVDAEEADLAKQEEHYWRELNDLQVEISTFQEKRDSLMQQSERVTEQLEKLKRTNVYNDAFHIWFDGPYGTINNFRMGRLANAGGAAQQQWDEVNAGWGQAALLLVTISTKVGFSFSTYRIIPMGSFSKVAKIGDERFHQKELFASQGFTSSKKNFNTAMTYFLHCLKEIGDFAEERDRTVRGLRLPYQIDGEKIGELSIRYTQNNDQNWTKALKYMLTNLKWLLAWCSKQP